MKEDITLLDSFDVELVQHSGSDSMIAAAARVSTGKDLSSYDSLADAKLINYLVKHRHGSPFEHSSMTFRVSAPIFVFREFMRHRIGFSYNEISGRYKILEPNFYVYPEERPLIQSGSSAHPLLSKGDTSLTRSTNSELRLAYDFAWDSYKTLLADGVANEVARSVLPVGIYSEMYVTCNARSLMAFLSLRIDASNSQFDTKPQWEIEQVAKHMEEIFVELFPSTWDAFNNNGRVSP
jgi:thymidylate synthase (FAD)